MNSVVSSKPSDKNKVFLLFAPLNPAEPPQPSGRRTHFLMIRSGGVSLPAGTPADFRGMGSSLYLLARPGPTGPRGPATAPASTLTLPPQPTPACQRLLQATMQKRETHPNRDRSSSAFVTAVAFYFLFLFFFIRLEDVPGELGADSDHSKSA